MTRFLIALLAAASTTALKTPKPRALKVRGGSTVQKVGTALIGLEGVVGMIAPEAACKNYGHEPTADDVQVKRYTSTWAFDFSRVRGCVVSLRGASRRWRRIVV